MTQIGLVSAGVYVPQTFITSTEIAARTGIPEAVIRERFGIEQKPVAGPDDHTNVMAVKAAQDACRRGGVDPSEIDVVLCTTEEWKEHPLWTAGVALAHDLGAKRAWAIDVQLRCGTTIAALKLARALMAEDPSIRTVLIAGGYRNGDFVDFTNARARFLINLSAGGGALLLRRDHPRNRLLGVTVKVDGSFSRDVIVPAGGTVEALAPGARPGEGRYALDVPDPEGMKQRLDTLSMQNFVGVLDEALAQSGHGRKDIGYLNILHMKRSAHDYVLKEMGVSDAQTTYLSRYGHVGQQDQAISLIEGLDAGKIKDGTLVAMVAAGIGYAWAAAAVQWGPQ